MIVNATCAQGIALSTSGSNASPAYPFFPQGESTADAPLTNPVADYVARTPSGELLREQRITFRPHSKQFLLITGSLERSGDPDHLPGVGIAPPVAPSFLKTQMQGSGHGTDANLQFHVIPCEGVVKDPCHYRIVNGIPGKTLVVRKPAEGMQSAKELAYLTPGNSVLLTGQPPQATYEIEIGGTVTRLEILQEGAVADCLIPFYLRDGKPAYSTVFESP